MTEFPAVRTVEEWVGETPDTPIPQRVRMRVFEAKKGRCHKCTRKILAGETWTCEHVIAITNGGENREKNLDCTCCNCLPEKNAEDVAIKAKGYRTRSRHFGVKTPSKRPIQGSRNTKWKKKLDGTTVRRD